MKVLLANLLLLTEKEYEEMMAAVQEKAFKEMSSTNLKSANDFMDEK